MQVTHIQDHVTHAVIGGQKAIDFGISDSPEFFNILSSTLYSDQILAVVREVLCNAWDVHIESGCTNLPVDITLSDDKVIFRDYGYGISDDDIGPIYGTYGGSTKKANGQVTGGFGLGCKAPFCLTDHFEVISMHAGKKTIYNLSKSSAEVNGKPGIIPIASFPTSETGLQVSIPIKTSDRRRFEMLIRQITANGEMNVKLNGEQLDVMPFSSMRHGYIITLVNPLTNHAPIMVRYGNVIYPVPNEATYAPLWERLHELLARISAGVNGSYRIVFQAPPHSISVTPSRESLSMQQHTLATLTDLMKRFVDDLDAGFDGETIKITESLISNTWLTDKPANLFSTTNAVPGLYPEKDAAKHLFELPQVVRRHMFYTYPSGRKFRQTDLMLRVNSLIQSGFGDSRLLNNYRAELLRTYRKGQEDAKCSWLHKQVIAPMLLGLKEANLSPSKLLAYVPGPFSYHAPRFVEAIRFEKRKLEGYLPYLRNIVVLTHSRVDVTDRLPSFPIMRHWLGSIMDTLVYVVPRNSKKAEEARQFFTQRGVQLLDLTISHPWEHTEVLKPAVRETQTPRKKGIPALSSLMMVDVLRMSRMDNEDVPGGMKLARLEKPEIIVRLAKSENTTSLPNWGSYDTKLISELWGDKIGVVINATQHSKYLSDGAVDATNFIYETIATEVASNPRILEYLAYDIDRLNTFSIVDQLLRLISRIPEFRKEFGLVNNMTDQDKKYLQLWKVFSYKRWVSQDYPKVKATLDVVNAIKLDPAVTKLVAKLDECRNIASCLDVSNISSILLSKESTPEKLKQKKTARELVLLALKG